LQDKSAQTLIELQKRILYIVGVSVTQRARLSGGHPIRPS
jgi:hypothetical protein